MADMEAFRRAATAWAAAGAEGDAARGAAARELAARARVETVVLLEGPSDAAAVEALAVRRRRDLATEGVCVLPMGGAMSVGHFAGLLGPAGLGLRLTGLCDVAERPYYYRAFERAGACGGAVFACAADLEDELIRALGVGRVTHLVSTEGESRRLGTFVRQPAQRDRTPHQQLRRFLGTTAGRKVRYGRLLVEALDDDRVPAPLEGLLNGLGTTR